MRSLIASNSNTAWAFPGSSVMIKYHKYSLVHQYMSYSYSCKALKIYFFWAGVGVLIIEGVNACCVLFRGHVLRSYVVRPVLPRCLLPSVRSKASNAPKMNMVVARAPPMWNWAGCCFWHELQAKSVEVKSSLWVVFGFWKLSWDPKNDNTLSKIDNIHVCNHCGWRKSFIQYCNYPTHQLRPFAVLKLFEMGKWSDVELFWIDIIPQNWSD